MFNANHAIIPKIQINIHNYLEEFKIFCQYFGEFFLRNQMAIIYTIRSISGSQKMTILPIYNEPSHPSAD